MAMGETPQKGKVLNLESINPNVINIEYAVRGPIVQKAVEIENEMREGKRKPFTEIVKCNIGDCHATGQKPLTFLRQVIALVTYPALMDDPTFPVDAKRRAKRLLSCCAGESVGSYSQSTGLDVVREDVAAYIKKRDGISSDPDNIFLSTGASEAIKAILQLLSTGQPGAGRVGIMVPLPQYPLYSATNAEYNAYQIEYYLDEDNNWALSIDELDRALTTAKEHCQPRALVVINPGNPTGQVLSLECMQEIIRFAIKNRLVLMADEVYQHNIYQPEQHPWYSFKRVLHEMGPGYTDDLELASFMSCSKGYMGECGFRGGYCELTNFDPLVKAQLYKALSARLCPSVIGQAMVAAVVNPPNADEPSYVSFTTERSSILASLKRKAELTSLTLNSMPGISCNPVHGAMYAFPSLQLPQKAILRAKEQGEQPDFFYCRRFLEEKGVCVVPGSGFGQRAGTYHFRITILPPEDKMTSVMQSLRDFHLDFMKEYS